MQLKMEGDGIIERLISDEATFHICGKVNRHIVRMWGTKQPRAQTEHQRDSPEVNAFCAVSRGKVHGPFLFTEATVTGDSFLDRLENWLLSQLTTNYDNYIHVHVRLFLNHVLPQRWILHHAISFFWNSAFMCHY
jgi:hypothetical protein